MFIYPENDNESHRNTQNKNLKLKTHPTTQITCSNTIFFKNTYFQNLDMHFNQRFRFFLWPFPKPPVAINPGGLLTLGRG